MRILDDLGFGNRAKAVFDDRCLWSAPVQTQWKIVSMPSRGLRDRGLGLSNQCKRTLIRGNHYTPMFGLSPDERYLVTDRMSENRNSYTRIWDITNGEKLTVLEDAGFVGFSPDGLTLVTTRHNGDIELWYFPGLVGLLQEL